MLARKMWQLLEPIHGLVYFSPEARSRFDAEGLKGFWMGYFASRAAALGPVGPELVEATFYVFHRAMVARALPDAWQFSTPEAVLAARYEAAELALQTALGHLADGEEIATAARLATPIAQAVPRAGHPLGAAHVAAPLPEEHNPLGRLWWAATVLREHRFDGHVAALVGADVDACGSLVLAAATGALGPDGATMLRTARKWPEDEWAEAADRLAARGWLDQEGGITEEGRAGHTAIEDATDRAADSAYASVDAADLDALVRALEPVVARIAVTGTFPVPNPIGITPKAQ